MQILSGGRDRNFTARTKNETAMGAGVHHGLSRRTRHRLWSAPPQQFHRVEISHQCQIERPPHPVHRSARLETVPRPSLGPTGSNRRCVCQRPARRDCPGRERRGPGQRFVAGRLPRSVPERSCVLTNATRHQTNEHLVRPWILQFETLDPQRASRLT
jgi:hypothetical protein